MDVYYKKAGLCKLKQELNAVNAKYSKLHISQIMDKDIIKLKITFTKQYKVNEYVIRAYMKTIKF